MPSETSVVNVALRRLGAPRISDFDTSTTHEAKIAQDIFDETRDRLLRSHTWSFATLRAQLSQSLTEPVFGYDYAYTLPSGWLRIISAHASDSTEDHIEYKLETLNISGTDTRVLITYANEVYVRYIKQITDVNLMDASFRDALAEHLARDMALAMNKPASIIEVLQKKANQATAYAKSVDGIEDYPDSFAEGSWVTSRYDEW